MSGVYFGSKTLFGETITANVNFKDSTNLDISITGDFTLNCNDESYSLLNNQIILDDIGVVGDCAHDSLVDNNIVIGNIVYDNVKNDITLSVVYSVLHLDIVLTQKGVYEPIYYIYMVRNT